MFGPLVENFGFTPVFVTATILATTLAPAGAFIGRKRPIIGTLLKAVGTVVQLGYGVAVSGGALSDTVKSWIIG